MGLRKYQIEVDGEEYNQQEDLKKQNVKKQSKSKLGTVQPTSNNTDDTEVSDKSRQRVLLKRRLMAMGVLCVIVFGGLTKTLVDQNIKLKEMNERKILVVEQLNELKEEQERLKMEIKHLEDDEYVAKIARRDFFLSKPGEIIFTIPTDNKR